MSDHPIISVIIPTYNRGVVLCQMLPFILRQTFADYEILVVDQTASYPKAVQQELSRWTEQVRWIRLPEPNVSAARNAGVREAKGPWIVFVDDDVEVPPDYLQRLSRHVDVPGVGAVMGLMLPDKTSDLFSVRAEARSMFYVSGSLNAGDTVEIRWVSSCSAMYRKQALLEVGGFDDYLRSWCEDADASVRIRARGYRLLLDTTIHAVHWGATEGGCENRNPAVSDQTARIRVRLFAYFLFKDRMIIGWREVLRGLRQSYRDFVLNRHILKRGLGLFLARHGVFLKDVWQAWGDGRASGPRAAP